VPLQGGAPKFGHAFAILATIYQYNYKTTIHPCTSQQAISSQHGFSKVLVFHLLTYYKMELKILVFTFALPGRLY
jgi:hypothetical protein